jgi:tRNA U34 2-thiouridine synthase MnmA/TrmU
MIFNENGKYICKLGKGIEGVSEGQSAVVYNGKIVVGGGEIRFS